MKISRKRCWIIVNYLLYLIDEPKSRKNFRRFYSSKSSFFLFRVIGIIVNIYWNELIITFNDETLKILYFRYIQILYISNILINLLPTVKNRHGTFGGCASARPQECLESLLHLDAQYRSWPRQTH